MAVPALNSGLNTIRGGVNEPFHSVTVFLFPVSSSQREQEARLKC